VNPAAPSGRPPAPSDALAVQVRKRHAASAASRDGGLRLEVDFEAPSGVTILFGPSGAGKTTLLRCIAGLCDPEQGRIAIGGRLLFDSRHRINVPPEQRKTAFVFQDLALFPHLTVEDNVAYGLRRLDAAERERRRAGIMEAFHVAHLRRRLPRQTSGGEQQRVALARSLVIEPAVLLLDEPLSSLDVDMKAGIIDDLLTWNAVRRIPILYVTHDYKELLALGDRVVVLEQGRIAAAGAPLDVVPRPRRAAMAQPSGFENLFDATVLRINTDAGTMRCRLADTAIELEVPLTRVDEGAAVRVGIRAAEILLSLARPAMLGVCNVVHGRVLRLDRVATKIEVRLDCGTPWRVDLPAGSLDSTALQRGDEAWLIVRTHCCHLVRALPFGPVQRLFVFICSRNTSRSPMAQAICNAEIARRLKVPFGALSTAGARAVSAGLSATPGEPLAAAAQHALTQLQVPIVAHRSQNLTAELVESAEAIFCMTGQQRDLAIRLFPAAAAKTSCLLSSVDLEEPAGRDAATYLAFARQIDGAVHQRMDQLLSAAD
jgi:molybdate transport system ATP-binding protein